MSYKTLSSLESKLSQFKSPVEMLRNSNTPGYAFPFPAEYTNWREEQIAWKKSVVLFDQSFHMTDFYFEGPDVKRLMSDIGVNSMVNFGKNRAKQLVACNYDGFVIGDAILFGHSNENFSVVGRPSVPNWAAFHAENGDYDVKVTRDFRSFENSNDRLLYRYQIQGPNSLELIKKVHEGKFPDIPFFHIGDLKIAGCKVRALNHSMSRMPGLEIHGPKNEGDRVLSALVEAGSEFNLHMGGSRAYATVSPESGWIPSPMPAIYTGNSMKPYREWLSADGFEASASLGGSYYSDNIEDYYQTPWDLGYGGHIKFDHDFIGRASLEKLKNKSHRKKVWLDWNKEDTLKVIGGMIGKGEKYKHLEMPNSYYSILPFDKVIQNDKIIGLGTYSQYTANVRNWFSLAMIDEANAINGNEVNLIWGEEDNSEHYIQIPVRATIRTNPI